MGFTCYHTNEFYAQWRIEDRIQVTFADDELTVEVIGYYRHTVPNAATMRDIADLKRLFLGERRVNHV